MSQTLKLLPIVRAYCGGHGLDPQDEKTSAYTARYALHLAATNILFFMQAVEDKNKSTKTEDEASTSKIPEQKKSSDFDDDIPF